MSRRSKLLRQRRDEAKRAAREIDDIRGLLGNAYRSFNSTSDPALLDAYIFEINALMARYDYALRRAKAHYDM